MAPELTERTLVVHIRTVNPDHTLEAVTQLLPFSSGVTGVEVIGILEDMQDDADEDVD
jgi:hypothetical protein